ncbi:hypothetical protein SRHO_G00111680 [Serrasalmus rhombeus]
MTYYKLYFAETPTYLFATQPKDVHQGGGLNALSAADSPSLTFLDASALRRDAAVWSHCSASAGQLCSAVVHDENYYQPQTELQPDAVRKSPGLEQHPRIPARPQAWA